MVEAARDGTAVEHVVTVSELDLLDAVPAALAGHAAPRLPRRDPACETCCAGGGDGAAAEVALDSPALLTYTSGTTGLPKGAINTHRAVDPQRARR